MKNTYSSVALPPTVQIMHDARTHIHTKVFAPEVKQNLQTSISSKVSRAKIGKLKQPSFIRLLIHENEAYRIWFYHLSVCVKLPRILFIKYLISRQR